MIEHPPFEKLVHPGQLSVTETKPKPVEKPDLQRLFYQARDDYLRHKREKENKR